MQASNLRALIARRVSIVLLVSTSFALSLAEIFRKPADFQWDLKVYYNAPLEFMSGLNPYHVSHFVYPPIFLPLFRIFPALFSYDQYYLAFLIAKILSFVALLYLWKKYFLRKTSLEAFALFVWLGFYSTCLVDFHAGNISVFETTILFLAFVCFLKDKITAFILFILLGASFKLTPVFFLLLLPLSKQKGFLAGCLAFLLFGLLNFLLFPAFTTTFFSEAIQRTGENGFICPSLLALTTDTLAVIFAESSAVPIAGKVIYLALASAILFVSWREVRSAEIPKPTLIAFLILVFVIAMPRMKDYAYMIAIPSVLMALEDTEIRPPRWILFLPLIFITPDTTTPVGFRGVFHLFWNYYPWFLAFLFWLMYIQRIRKISLSCAELAQRA